MVMHRMSPLTHTLAAEALDILGAIFLTNLPAQQTAARGGCAHTLAASIPYRAWVLLLPACLLTHFYL